MGSIISNNGQFELDTNVNVASDKGATIFSNEDIGGATPIGIGQGQLLISNPVVKKKSAKEAYLNEGNYDDDQELAIQVLREDGLDISPYVTPDNSPEQMFEIANAIAIGLPDEKLIKISDPQVSFMAIQVILKAWKIGVDLTPYLPWADPFVLNQALIGAKRGLDLSKFIIPGFDHRQIEQMRRELESGGDPSRLSGNYNQMRAKRFPGHNISNINKHR